MQHFSWTERALSRDPRHLRRICSTVNAILVLLLSSTSHAAAGHATLTGIVSDASSAPIANATVLVYSAGLRTGYNVFCPTCYVDCGKRASTDASERFTISGLDDELTFNLLVLKPGYAPEWIKSADPLQGAAVTAVVKPRQQITDLLRVVRGQIADVHGQPVADALVELRGARVIQDGEVKFMFGSLGAGTEPLAVSDDKGEFEIVSGLPAEQLIAVISPRGRAPLLVTSPTGGERRTITVTDGATIRGRLLKNGKPVSGVELGLMTVRHDVTAYPEERISSDASGRFEFTNVPPGRVWDLYARMGSFSGRGAMTPIHFATEHDGQDIDVGDIRIQAGFTVRGQVRLSDGTAIGEGMHLGIGLAEGWDSQTVPLGPDGSFTISGLVPGAYVLAPSVRGYRAPDNAFMELLVKHDIRGYVISLEPDTSAQ